MSQPRILSTGDPLSRTFILSPFYLSLAGPKPLTPARSFLQNNPAVTQERKNTFSLKKKLPWSSVLSRAETLLEKKPDRTSFRHPFFDRAFSSHASTILFLFIVYLYI
jgi:hypothetical protein